MRERPRRQAAPGPLAPGAPRTPRTPGAPRPPETLLTPEVPRARRGLRRRGHRVAGRHRAARRWPVPAQQFLQARGTRRHRHSAPPGNSLLAAFPWLFPRPFFHRPAGGWPGPHSCPYCLPRRGYQRSRCPRAANGRQLSDLLRVSCPGFSRQDLSRAAGPPPRRGPTSLARASHDRHDRTIQPNGWSGGLPSQRELPPA
jgi:hypothetical protein